MAFLVKAATAKYLAELASIIKKWVDDEDSRDSGVFPPKIPAEFKKLTRKTVYRGHGLNEREFKEMEKKGNLEVHGASWTFSKSVADSFAFDSSAPYTVLLKYAPKPNDVVININVAAKALKVENEHESEEEIVLGIVTIPLKDITYANTGGKNSRCPHCDYPIDSDDQVSCHDCGRRLAEDQYDDD